MKLSRIFRTLGFPTLPKRKNLCKPTNTVIRIRAIELYNQGVKKIRISEELGVNYYTILNWIKRYEQHGESGLKADYSQCDATSRFAEELKAEAIQMKGEYSEWGSDYIRMKLHKKYPEVCLPSSRQLRRYFVEAGVSQSRASKLPKAAAENTWAKQEFYRVQVDAKEQLQTKDGKYCSYLTFTDEKSGAVLDAFVLNCSWCSFEVESSMQSDQECKVERNQGTIARRCDDSKCKDYFDLQDRRKFRLKKL